MVIVKFILFFQTRLVSSVLVVDLAEIPHQTVLLTVFYYLAQYRQFNVEVNIMREGPLGLPQHAVQISQDLRKTMPQYFRSEKIDHNCKESLGYVGLDAG
jgi:hypothetical protein